MIGFSKDVLPSGDAVFQLFFAVVCLFMYIYVVVNVFIMYANEVKTKEKYKLPAIKKINYNIYEIRVLVFGLGKLKKSVKNDNTLSRISTVKILSHLKHHLITKQKRII